MYAAPLTSFRAHLIRTAPPASYSFTLSRHQPITTYSAVLALEGGSGKPTREDEESCHNDTDGHFDSDGRLDESFDKDTKRGKKIKCSCYVRWRFSNMRTLQKRR